MQTRKNFFSFKTRFNLSIHVQCISRCLLRSSLYALLLSGVSFSCSRNVLTDASSKTTDADYLLFAQQALNSEKYDEAIQIITQKMSLDAQNQVQAREVLASSYAGKCGLNFIEYTQALSQQTTGSAFKIMMMPFVGKTVSPQNCRTSLDTMELIGPTAGRTQNQNAFVAIVGMVLIGSASRGYADISPALGDGTADVNICSGVTDAQMDDIIIGFGFMSKNFSALSSSLIGGTSQTTLNQVINTCSTVAGETCQITDPTKITVSVRNTVRDLMNTQEYGIGTYSTGGNDLLLPGACP